MTINFLIAHFGWRRAFEVTGAAILVVLFPIGGWITRSAPEAMGLVPDGEAADALSAPTASTEASEAPSVDVRRAVRTANFWLLVVGCSLVIGAIGTVIQHLVLFLEDQGYSPARAAAFSSGLLVSSLAGRVIVGFLADRFRKKNVMALFYAVLGLAIPLLFLARQPRMAWAFALIFGFAMGADYMLVPLVTAECFGRAALGKLLALIIMGYSLGQWFDPWLAGRIFDIRHSYDWAWRIMAVSGVLGAVIIWLISPAKRPSVTPGAPYEASAERERPTCA